jgi:FtsH-binding integral membrane protein
MPAITILIGMMLILVGLGGYGWAVVDSQRGGGPASFTALIPSIIGLIITIAGGIATNEKLRKHAMHAAVLVALLGFLAVAGRLIPALFSGKPMNGIAFGSQALTAILCGLLVALGVNSFIQARRKRA